ETIYALNSHNCELSISDTVSVSCAIICETISAALTVVKTLQQLVYTNSSSRIILSCSFRSDQLSSYDFQDSFIRELLQISSYPMGQNSINQKDEGPKMNEKFIEQYSKLMSFADNLKELIELVKCIVQSSKKHRKNPHMLPSLSDDEIFKLSKSLKQLSSIMKDDCAKNSVDKAHRMFAELSEQNLNYLKQVSIKAIVKMENYFEDRLPLIKNAKPKFDLALSDYNIENCKYNALKLKFEQASEGGKLVKEEIKIKAEQRFNQAREAYRKELHNGYKILNNFSEYENEVMQALRMLIQYRLEFHENALKIFKQ
ncbi:hypothetical protein T10_35, partial [Trichinella papuae]